MAARIKRLLRPAVMTHPWVIRGLGTLLWLTSGCGDVFSPSPAPLFSVPLTIEGEPIGPAVIDTGGSYEVMLRDSFGLLIVDRMEVLAFAGKEFVDVTEGFHYTAGGLEADAEAALVGVSVCDCNGLGFMFFRNTGVVLGLDYANQRATFLPAVPENGVTIRFEPPPSFLPGFDSAFVEVEVASDDSARTVLALIDTGTNASVIRRGLIDARGAAGCVQPVPFRGTGGSGACITDGNPLSRNRLRVTVTREDLGTVDASLGLFDTPGLPDMIIGTDIMRAWSDRWYFSFTPQGGTVTAFPHVDAAVAETEAGPSRQ